MSVWSSGSVDLVHSNLLYSDLSGGLDGLQLSSCLHLAYLVTPYDMVSQCSPDWMTFFRQVRLLGPPGQRVATRTDAARLVAAVLPAVGGGAEDVRRRRRAGELHRQESCRTDGEKGGAGLTQEAEQSPALPGPVGWKLG